MSSFQRTAWNTPCYSSGKIKYFLQPIMRALYRNGVVVDGYDKDSTQFINEFPRGAYTAARSVDYKYLFQFKEHVIRLNNSCKIMIQEQFGEVAEPLQSLISFETLSKRLISELRAGWIPDQDFKITILINWKRSEYDIYIHYADLPPTPEDPVTIEMFPGSRTHIKAKDSDWSRYRKHIELMRKDPSSNEIVLVDHDSNCYEGLSSNFFIVKSGKVQTALKGVLYGTVMDLVLEVCRDIGIEIISSPPQLVEIDSWDEVFITSTSRLVLPVKHIHVHQTKIYFDGVAIPLKEEGDSVIMTKTFPTDFSTLLGSQVKKKLLEHSTKIIE